MGKIAKMPNSKFMSRYHFVHKDYVTHKKCSCARYDILLAYGPDVVQSAWVLIGQQADYTILFQLLNDPPILFCDEPTTGLDSFSAAAVVSRLRKLAAGGKLVICSVHQPASGTFEMFHQVVLLANGRTAFHGTIQQADEFFASWVPFAKAFFFLVVYSWKNGRRRNVRSSSFL